MAKFSSDTKNLFEIRRFEGIGFDLWKERMHGILFLKDCDEELVEIKPETMEDEAWQKLNQKAIAYIKMAVLDDILFKIKVSLQLMRYGRN